MDDNQILERINALMDEEHQLRTTTPGGGEGVDDGRLRNLEEMLDQCWDLLRQRRARRQYGDTPDDARERDTGTVEGYQQ